MADTTQHLTHVYLKLAGQDAPDALMVALLEVTVETSLHLPSVATVILNDPGLSWIDDPRLLPGAALEISSQAGQTTGPLFDGEIVELEPDFQPHSHRLIVRAFDRLHRLSRGNKTRSFLNQNDSDIVSRIAGEVGLQPDAASTPVVHDYIFQNNQTNLEFLRQRAAALGYLLYVSGRKLVFKPPDPAAKPVPLVWGQSLFEFHPRLTTVDQVVDVTVRGWDPASRQEIVGKATNGNGTPKIGLDKPGGELAKEAFNLTAQSLIADRPVRTQTAADQLAQAGLNRLAGGYIEADGVAAGNPELNAGALADVSAVGERFSGKYYVTGTTHRYALSAEGGGYTTTFSVSGLRPSGLLSMLARDDDAPQPTIAVGVVTDNQDPQGQGRVKVKYPWLSASESSFWARVVAPGAGPKRGIQYIPEVNDEVLVGFEMSDINHPYVLGGLWNGVDEPPEKSSAIISGGKVQKRIIRSRAGHIITLDDSDGGGGISIVDKNGNKIVIDSQSNELTIELKGNIGVKAQGNLKLEAMGQVEIKGTGIKVESSATLDLKGAIVNLN